ncbi:transposable element Tcb2 transposase [Trichonephila clavipes]|uniref:Transposable element Tcb2 transposase n=1 Tax=Trichonephila clavipes TaxID=2585209 RepID=A0A8X6S8A0_TRICX|nr:transposable element Tcb2 transposase [Trichonephila clavipes]
MWMRTSEGDDRNIALNDRTASSGQLAAYWTIATGVLISASSILRRLLHRRLLARAPLSRIPLTAKHQWLRLLWASELRSWQVDRHQVVFSDESRFSLWDHEDRFRCKLYPGERCLSEGVIERYSCLTDGVMVWGGILYYGRSNFLRIEGSYMLQRLFETSAQPNTRNFFLRLVIRRIQAIRNSLPQADIQNLLDSMPRHIAALIAARVGYTKC